VENYAKGPLATNTNSEGLPFALPIGVFCFDIATIAPGISTSRRLCSAVPMAERIKNKFDSGRHSKFFVYPIEVIPDRMLLDV
jgi:hypothetical protein